MVSPLWRFDGAARSNSRVANQRNGGNLEGADVWKCYTTYSLAGESDKVGRLMSVETEDNSFAVLERKGGGQSGGKGHDVAGNLKCGH